MLELKKITKDYKVADTTSTVLKGITLSFRNSEFVSILGPSGCGKTTMLNIIGGLDKFTTGDLIINGKSTKEYKDRDWDTYRNHKIGFVFQSYNLIPHQNILKNVELALSIGGISKKERRERAKAALIEVGLEEHLNKKPNQLSGGQCQRVSIARALVTNPDIILADEPTGALDSETSQPVMELLKNIAKDRLVIMVTHNPDLAEKYSTRIIKMLDGFIIDDTNPISEEEKEELKREDEEKIQNLTEKELKQEEKKSSMSLATSSMLSASNLLTKKKRTFITSFACSIGIIGIAVILSVSNGMSSYVNALQQDSSSSNYISISNTTTSFDFSSFGNEEVTLTEYPQNATGVYPYEENTGGSVSTTQILSEDYINYLESNINGNSENTNLVLGISYTRDVNINLVAYNSDYDSNSQYYVVGTDNWNEILDNTSYISTQYTTLATTLSGNAIPTNYDEVALVVDSYNRLSTTILDQLGISYDEDLSEISYEDLLGKEFKLITNNEFYKVASSSEDSKDIYQAISSQSDLQNAYYSENAISVKIVSILRQNEDASNDWISTGIGYTQALTEKIIEENVNSDVVQYQKENSDYNVLTGQNFDSSSGGIFGSLLGNSDSYENNLMLLGATTTPTSITIYPKDFDSKDKIIEVLDNWNNTEIYKLYGNEIDEETGEYIAEAYQVQYTDISAMLVTMLSNLINIITYALVAFSAISLVVSSIMIAIITYASVIERTKEIGTIRSLGGRKRDVSSVFIVEAGIIGFVSAVIALIATLGLNAIINLVLGSLVGVTSIASLSFSTVIWMIVLSVGLNLIASLIPARIAAKKDPAVALRTE